MSDLLRLPFEVHIKIYHALLCVPGGIHLRYVAERHERKLYEQWIEMKESDHNREDGEEDTDD